MFCFVHFFKLHHIFGFSAFPFLRRFWEGEGDHSSISEEKFILLANIFIKFFFSFSLFLCCVVVRGLKAINLSHKALEKKNIFPPTNSHSSDLGLGVPTKFPQFC